MHSSPLSETTTMSTLIDLPIPSGFYLVIHPHYDTSGVVATLLDAKQKYPNNMECVHPGLCHFHFMMKPQDFGPDIDIVFLWFGNQSQFCAIGVGPFGRQANFEAEMLHFKAFTQNIGVPDSWLHLICFQKAK